MQSSELFEKLKCKPFVFAGPNVIESEEHVLKMASRVSEVMKRYDVTFVFKTSFDKANRTSMNSYRGVDIDKAITIFQKLRDLGILCITDVHESWQAKRLAGYVDILQIPAFLCRQTDLLQAAAETGCVIHIKKGQMCSADTMHKCVQKCVQFGNPNVILCERGNFFGYQDLVVDPRNLERLKGPQNLVSMDITHCLQQPAQKLSDGTVQAGGERHLIPLMGKMAMALGVNGVFMEVHDRPDESLCDAPTQWPLDRLEWLMGHLGMPREPSRLGHLLPTLDAFETLDVSRVVEAFTSAETVYFSGVGKSQTSASHLCCLLKSLGVRSFTIDPINANHGDIGTFLPKDVLVVFSKSGNTEELLPLLRSAKAKKCVCIGVVCATSSTLHKTCDLTVELPFIKEIDARIDCLPTNSILSQILFGNIVAQEMSSRTCKSDYKMNHLAGSIGRNLMQVKQLMKAEFPKIKTDSTTVPISEIWWQMVDKKMGIVVLDVCGTVGILTDGDVRRMLLRDAKQSEIHKEHINSRYSRVSPDQTIGDCPKTHYLPVVTQDGQIIGILDTTDIR